MDPDPNPRPPTANQQEPPPLDSLTLQEDGGGGEGSANTHSPKLPISNGSLPADFYADDEIEIVEEMPPPASPTSSGYAGERGSSGATSAVDEADGNRDGNLTDDWDRGKGHADEVSKIVS